MTDIKPLVPSVSKVPLTFSCKGGASPGQPCYGMAYCFRLPQQDLANELCRMLKRFCVVPELLILGCGRRSQQLPGPLQKFLVQHRISAEVLDTVRHFGSFTMFVIEDQLYEAPHTFAASCVLEGHRHTPALLLLPWATGHWCLIACCTRADEQTSRAITSL